MIDLIPILWRRLGFLLGFLLFFSLTAVQAKRLQSVGHSIEKIELDPFPPSVFEGSFSIHPSSSSVLTQAGQRGGIGQLGFGSLP